MRFKRATVCFSLAAALVFSACGRGAGTDKKTGAEETAEDAVSTALARIDGTKWNYNEEADVYWQTGISYCADPADASYETLGVYVPGAYMTAAENDDGTYTCEINKEGTVAGYTAETAPIVLPVNTPGYAAMAAPDGYESQTAEYTDAGFVYVYAGCRGRDAGAPAGVTDLKAAIRYVRYNEGNIPGDTERIFSFGMSGGGAQSALLGATGNSALYTPYLEEIGAVEGVSDAVAGSMCWCPITNLDYADEAYEWNLGVTRTDLDEEMQALSDQMAEAFALYVNELGLKDEDGTTLSLEESETGIYQAGSYYAYVKETIEESLEHFLEDTSFPYEASSDGKGGFGGGGMPQNGAIEGEGGLPDKTELQEGELPDRTELQEGGLPDRTELPEGGLPENAENGLPDKGTGQMRPDGADASDDDIQRNESQSGIALSGTYETAQDYIAALNQEQEWVTYDDETGEVSITSVADFVKALKPASKSVGAFDDLDAAQGENELFGYGDGNGAHFDSVMAGLLAENETYGASYTEDLTKTDALGTSVETRVAMYNPLYYLCDYYDGYQTSDVAQHWRIRTGIEQGDTALTTEINLALALENYGADVDFETVWGQGHTEAERTGGSSENFIAWVNALYN